MTQGVRFEYGAQHACTRVPERRGSLALGEVLYPRMLAAQVAGASQDALDTYHMHELRGVELTNERTTPAHAE